MSEGREMTIPHNYCQHVFPLHAKAVIITDTNAKGRLMWGNGKDAEHGPADIGLHAEQVSLNRPGRHMLVMNFLCRLGCDLQWVLRGTPCMELLGP